MDSYFTRPGIQMSFQRRLSRLYNDTKKSTDFVKEPVQNAEDPEIKALHRKLRIQKDRLVSWGLKWSDPSQSSEVLIDSSLSRAGLSEVVSSIMSTIKETLAEVEPLWLSSRRLVGGSASDDSDGNDKAAEAIAAATGTMPRDRDRDRDRDRKMPIVTWDKARFADLVHDLTTSIDTLYDLSHTRSSAASGSGGGNSSSGSGGGIDRKASHSKLALASSASWSSPSSLDSPSAKQQQQQQQQQQLMKPYTNTTTATTRRHHSHGDASLTTDEANKLFESSRMRIPQQIDSAVLTIIESSTRPPENPSMREVVFMNKASYTNLIARPITLGYAPLLLEYAYFDPVFSSTGILPSMARFEKLSAGLGLLHGEDTRPPLSGVAWSGNPRLLGYFEDMDHSRLGLVYQFPDGFHAITSSEYAVQTPVSLRACLYSLSDLLGSPGVEPKLEAKFRLASHLANAVFEMHAKGIAHGNLVDASILFGRVAHPDAGLSPADVSQVDIRKPLISSFDLFPDTPSPDMRSGLRRCTSRLHQHPLSPTALAPGAPPLVDADPRVFDLYSLAMLLLSIGMWTRLENLVPNQDSAMVSEAVLEQLATQCGTLYMKAVQTCWNAVEMVVAAGKASGESYLARLQVRASSYLEACCVLDDVSKLDERLRNDLGGDDIVSAAAAPAMMTAVTPTTTPAPPPMLARAASMPPPRPPLQYQEQHAPLPSPRLPPRLPQRQALRQTTMSSTPSVHNWSATVDVDAKPPPIPPKMSPYVQIPPAGAAVTVMPASTGVTVPKSDVPAKSRMRLYPQVALPPDAIEMWHTLLMPQVNYALRHFYRSHPESVEISLEAVGDSVRNTRPTVVVVCTSVSTVRGILKRKMGAVFESAKIGLKVCAGRVMRSHKTAAAAMGEGGGNFGGRTSFGKKILAANSQFQQKPHNGASIGAWIGDRHLPPVSFGGLVLIDNKPFGMTVHHMLDDPDATTEASATAAAAASAAREGQKALRSSGAAAAMTMNEGDNGDGDGNDDDEAQRVAQLGRSVLDWYAELQENSLAVGGNSSGSDDDEDYACEFSDTSSAVSESDITSEWSDSDNEVDYKGRSVMGLGATDDDSGDDNGVSNHGNDEPGDMPGVEPGYGDSYTVTQPALDDVDGNFYPDEATQDEDHLDSCSLGDVYASSGVRRRVDSHGLVHEIDWALFEFKAERLPPNNSMPFLPLRAAVQDEKQPLVSKSAGCDDAAPGMMGAGGILRPTTVAPASLLPGLEVQCVARTSGLQTGRILPTITSVKIYGRQSPSHTYQISAAGDKSSQSALASMAAATSHPIGIPGDSGAWIVEREHGRLCGHVLAWSTRKRVAYLCPMEVLLLDIAETLETDNVRLPGGEPVDKIVDANERRSRESATGRGRDGSSRSNHHDSSNSSSPTAGSSRHGGPRGSGGPSSAGHSGGRREGESTGGGSHGGGSQSSSGHYGSGSSGGTGWRRQRMATIHGTGIGIGIGVGSPSTSSLSLQGSFTTDGGGTGLDRLSTTATFGVEQIDEENEKGKHDDGDDEGFGDENSADVKKATTAAGKKRWHESTKMMELMRSMGRVRLDRGSDVQAPCS